MAYLLAFYLLFFSLLLFLSSFAQTNCSDFQFHGKSYDSCSDLPTLNSFIHWNYNPSSGTVDIAFRKSENKYGRWLAWAINPTSTGMIGSQAFVALQRSDAQNINGHVIIFATLQFLAHCLRLKKEHKHRVYWNIYHWCTGYGTIILAIVNCFKGFQLMDEGMWKRVYIAFLASLAFVAFDLEVLRWYLMRATKETSSANGDIEDKA
ncbi:hypothetical protein P3S68_025518 [Capsicum galapagoense]